MNTTPHIQFLTSSGKRLETTRAYYDCEREYICNGKVHQRHMSVLVRGAQTFGGSHDIMMCVTLNNEIIMYLYVCITG